MVETHGSRNSSDEHQHKDLNTHPGKKSNTGFTTTTIFRTLSSAVIFGIPLVVGTATVLWYGMYKAYKAIRR